jgi:hypothetical protein
MIRISESLNGGKYKTKCLSLGQNLGPREPRSGDLSVFYPGGFVPEQ